MKYISLRKKKEEKGKNEEPAKLVANRDKLRRKRAGAMSTTES